MARTATGARVLLAALAAALLGSGCGDTGSVKEAPSAQPFSLDRITVEVTGSLPVSLPSQGGPGCGGSSSSGAPSGGPSISFTFTSGPPGGSDAGLGGCVGFALDSANLLRVTLPVRATAALPTLDVHCVLYSQNGTLVGAAEGSQLNVQPSQLYTLTLTGRRPTDTIARARFEVTDRLPATPQA